MDFFPAKKLKEWELRVSQLYFWQESCLKTLQYQRINLLFVVGQLKSPLRWVGGGRGRGRGGGAGGSPVSSRAGRVVTAESKPPFYIYRHCQILSNVINRRPQLTAVSHIIGVLSSPLLPYCAWMTQILSTFSWRRGRLVGWLVGRWDEGGGGPVHQRAGPAPTTSLCNCMLMPDWENASGRVVLGAGQRQHWSLEVFSWCWPPWLHAPARPPVIGRCGLIMQIHGARRQKAIGWEEGVYCPGPACWLA